MKRIALIGCGDHSRRFHAPALAMYRDDHPGRIDLTAACDLDPTRAEQFRRQFGFAKACGDYRQMLAAESIDGCICPVSTTKTVEIASDLLERKIPCLIEKPLGSSPIEARRLAEAAEATGTPHLVSVNRRFNPYLRKARTWARQAGAIRYVRGTIIRHKRREGPFIWTTAIHAVDALVYIAGKIRTHRVETLGRSEMTSRWYAISLQFANGCLGHVEVLPTAGTVSESYEMFGEGFRARAEVSDTGSDSARCWRDKHLELAESAPPDEPVYVSNGSYREVVEFVSMIEQRPYEGPTVGDVMEASKVCFDLAGKLGV